MYISELNLSYIEKIPLEKILYYLIQQSSSQTIIQENKMHRVKDKIALITGGCGGIGKAVANLLKEEGAEIIISDIQDQEGECLANNIGGKYYHLDVTSETEWRNTSIKIQKEFGRIDILINNAGIFGFKDSFGEQDPEHASLHDWRIIHQINLDGVFLGCKYGIELMRKNGGSIINMSSRAGVIGVPGAAAYASSKAAIRNHTKSVALYCAEKKYNIRCNSIHPGLILTPLWDQILGTDKASRANKIAEAERRIPVGYMGSPKDVAYAALYLAADESKYVTGIELTVDGGMMAGNLNSPQKDHSFNKN